MNRTNTGINVCTDKPVKVRSAVLYSSRFSGPGRRLVYSSEDLGQIFVRVEIKKLDVSDALDRAHPEEGETVLNTIPID